MKLKGDPKFKGKLSRGLKTDIRNLVNFHVSNRKSHFAHLHIDGLFLSKAYENVQKSDAKFEEKLTLGSKNGIRN